MNLNLFFLTSCCSHITTAYKLGTLHITTHEHLVIIVQYYLFDSLSSFVCLFSGYYCQPDVHESHKFIMSQVTLAANGELLVYHKNGLIAILWQV